MDLVMKYEKEQGRNPLDVSKDRVGYDIKSDNRYIEVNILVHLKVVSRLFLGHLPLKQIRGFVDENKGNIMTPGFTTDWLNAKEVENNWMRVTSLEELAVKPLMQLTALDLIDRPQ